MCYTDNSFIRALRSCDNIMNFHDHLLPIPFIYKTSYSLLLSTCTPIQLLEYSYNSRLLLTLLSCIYRRKNCIVKKIIRKSKNKTDNKNIINNKNPLGTETVKKDIFNFFLCVHSIFFRIIKIMRLFIISLSLKK